MPGEHGPAAGGRQEGGEHPHGRRLARPVGAEEADDLPSAHREAHPVHGPDRVIMLRQPLDFDHGGSRSRADRESRSVECERSISGRAGSPRRARSPDRRVLGGAFRARSGGPTNSGATSAGVGPGSHRRHGVARDAGRARPPDRAGSPGRRSASTGTGRRSGSRLAMNAGRSPGGSPRGAALSPRKTATWPTSVSWVTSSGLDSPFLDQVGEDSLEPVDERPAASLVDRHGEDLGRPRRGRGR